MMKQSFCPDCQPIMISYNTLKPKILTAHAMVLANFMHTSQANLTWFHYKLYKAETAKEKESTLTIGG